MKAPLRKNLKLPPITWAEKNLANEKIQQKELWGIVEEYTGNPLLVNFLTKLIKKYNVPERDDIALARAIQLFSQQHIKFFRERPERFVSPLRTILWGIGDCDDKSIFIASSLRSFKIPIRLKFIYFKYTGKDGIEKEIYHVYPVAKLNGIWTALESVHPWALGDDPEDRAKARGIKPQISYIGDN